MSKSHGNQWQNAIFSLAWFAKNHECVLHAYGKHGAFSGRRYRKGKNRCLFCGAYMDAEYAKITFVSFVAHAKD